VAEQTRTPKPIPDPQGLNREFYVHLARGKLCFQRCNECDTWQHPPRVLCASCGSQSWRWEASTGRGKIYSWTVIRQAMHPAFAAEVPYPVVIVELDEGVRLVSMVRGLGPEAVELDLPVEIDIEKISTEIALPYFRRMG
jgi:uncharacterized OB-fold protein